MQSGNTTNVLPGKRLRITKPKPKRQKENSPLHPPAATQTPSKQERKQSSKLRN